MEISKAKKGSDEYLIDYCDFIISDLVHEKKDMIKAYNYFNGVRDHYQYENLEKNFGIGTPTSVGFTPLTRKHVEVIVGEYMSTKPNPKVSCKDLRTLSLINRDKQLEIAKQLKDYISKYLNNALYKALANGGLQNQQEVQDDLIQRELDHIMQSISSNYISNFEIAAQDIITWVRQNRDIDFYNKVELLVLNLLIAGLAYYKVLASHNADNIKIEICDPLNTWIDKDPKSRYMKDAYKSVVRKWMTQEEIQIKYGDWMSQEQINGIKTNSWRNYYNDATDFIMVTGQCSKYGGEQGLIPGGVHPIDADDDYYKWDLIPVYEVEWVDVDKRDGKYVGYCYHVTRIASDIFILDAANDIMMPRNAGEPNVPRLNINGIWYTNGHGGPYSLMNATASLLDQYDMILYQMHNYIANSGTKGAIVDMAALPENLGSNWSERLQKYLGYRKNGMALINSAQDGASMPNTIYNGFDDSLNQTSIAGYVQSLEHIETIVSQMTGVTPQRLGNIEQRDAVANVEVGMQLSFLITKRYYKAMDTLVKEMLLDCIDMAKVVWKDGFMGEIVLGDEKKILEIVPEYYTLTSYGIEFKDSFEAIKEQEAIKQISTQYMSSNMMDPETLFEISISDSLTDMRERALKSIRKKKAENDLLQQLNLQLQQMTEQNKQLQKQVEESTKKIAQLNEKKLQIEQMAAQMDLEIQYAKIKSNEKLKEKELELIEKRTKLEGLQIIADDGKQNDLVNYSKY